MTEAALALPLKQPVVERLKHYHHVDELDSVRSNYSLFASLPSIALLWVYCTVLACYICALEYLPLYAVPVFLMPAITLGISIVLSYHRRYFVLGPNVINLVDGSDIDNITYFSIYRISIVQIGLQKYLGYGTIVIHTAGPQGKSYRLKGVTLPLETARSIEHYRVNANRELYAGYAPCAYDIDGKPVAGLW